MALVTASTARALLAVDSEELDGRVEEGRSLWVFNLGRSQRRELRFWLREIQSPDGLRHLVPAEAVEQILSTATTVRQHLRTREVGALLSVSRQTVQHFWRAGEITVEFRGHSAWLSRPSLAAWLLRRLVR